MDNKQDCIDWDKMDGWTNDQMNVQASIIVCSSSSLESWFVSPVVPNIYPYLPKSRRKSKTNQIFQWTGMRHEADVKRVWNVFNINRRHPSSAHINRHPVNPCTVFTEPARFHSGSHRAAAGISIYRSAEERREHFQRKTVSPNGLISKRAKKIKVFKWFQSSSAEFQFKNKPALMLVWVLAYWDHFWLDTKTSRKHLAAHPRPDSPTKQKTRRSFRTDPWEKRIPPSQVCKNGTSVLFWFWRSSSSRLKRLLWFWLEVGIKKPEEAFQEQKQLAFDLQDTYHQSG